MSNGTATKNGIRIPVWAVSLIVLLLVNVVTLVASLATIKADQRHTNENITEIKEDIAETRFEVGNISDGIADLQKQNTRFDEKCNEYDRRIGRLENQ